MTASPPPHTTLLQDWHAEHWSIDWGSLPDWLVLITAIIGTLLALRQLATANASTAAYLRSEQGTQLMAIDNMFEGELVASRLALLRLRFGAGAAAGCDSGPAFEAEVNRRLAGWYDQARRLGTGTATDQAAAEIAVKAYFEVMLLPLLIETIGVLVDQGLVNEAAVLKLYDAAIKNAVELVLPHVRARRRPGNPEYLLHAERLYDRACARLAAASSVQQAS